MKQPQEILKIYHLSHPFMNTEWPALAGDKYQGVLSFPWEIVETPEEAQVVVWDGVISPKLAPYLDTLLADLSDKKVLLLVGEALTLLKVSPLVSLVNLEKVQFVELPGWNALPEEILAGIEHCYKKLHHV